MANLFTHNTLVPPENENNSSVDSQEPKEFVSTKPQEKDDNNDDENATKSLVSIGKSISELIQEFDSYYQRTDNDDVKQIIGIMQQRLIETLCANGFLPIENESSFDILRHTPIPFAILPNGTHIKEFKRVGLTLDNAVVLKALVKV